MSHDTRTRMLDAAARLLQLRGYHGAALADILAESGAPRGSLYFHFPKGKDQLVIEATRAAVRGITQRRSELLEKAGTPAAAIHALAEGMIEMLRQTDYTLSCPIAPIILDGTNEIAELSELCRQAFEEWIDLLRAAFARAGVPEKRAAALAIMTQATFEGLLLIARAYRDTAPIATAAEELAAAVEAAAPTRKARAARL
jgi:TetR/AcrR family transcriptional repressor of lmrAB and yxaGH operons